MEKLQRWELIPDAMCGPYMLGKMFGTYIKADEAEAALAERDGRIDKLTIANGNLHVKISSDFQEAEAEITKLKARIKELDDNNTLLNAALHEAKRFMEQQENELIQFAGLDQGWVSVEDRLPELKEIPFPGKAYVKVSDEFYVFTKEGDRRVGYRHSVDGWLMMTEEGSVWIDNVTHWRPLPAAPGVSDEP